MGHLAAVWNITSALGASPRFGRTNFPLDMGYLPAGIVVKLAPFGEDVLQHFIHLERPACSDEPEGKGFEAGDYCFDPASGVLTSAAVAAGTLTLTKPPGKPAEVDFTPPAEAKPLEPSTSPSS